MHFIRFFVAFVICISLILPSLAEKRKDPAREANLIYDAILDAGNYDLVPYNHPAGSRELNLFGLGKKGQYNINSVISPDGENLVYTEVYFYPDPRVTASAIYLIPLDKKFSKKEAVLSVSTNDKLPQPIKETDYSKLYPFKFHTLTTVDWNKKSDKILFKEKFGMHFDQIYYTNLYLFDMTNETLYDLSGIRNKIMDYWASKGVFLSDYKWDIKPLGFLKANQNKVVVEAYGYYQKERKFLGVWGMDITGNNAYLISTTDGYKVDISANGECLKFLPDMGDLFNKQRRKDENKRKYVRFEAK